MSPFDENISPGGDRFTGLKRRLNHRLSRREVCRARLPRRGAASNITLMAGGCCGEECKEGGGGVGPVGYHVVKTLCVRRSATAVSAIQLARLKHFALTSVRVTARRSNRVYFYIYGSGNDRWPPIICLARSSPDVTAATAAAAASSRQIAPCLRVPLTLLPALARPPVRFNDVRPLILRSAAGTL